MLKLSVNTFTNPHEERVVQALVGGMPITREFPAGSMRPMDAARAEFDRHYGAAELWTWDAETGETLIERKL